MAEFSSNSEIKLLTSERDLQILFQEVIKYFDCTILYGYRSVEQQNILYSQGRMFVNNHWIISDSKKIVTYCDGTIKKSNHNFMPSRAIDALPYPIDGKDYNRMYYFAGHVIGIAKMLKEEGKITHEITFGGDWNSNTFVNDQTFFDLAHYEVKY